MARSALLMVAGEASGDLHGGRLLAELRGLGCEPHAFGLGGDEMAGAGLETVAHCREVSVVGVTEALRVLPRALQVFRRLLVEVDARRAKVAVLVDFPEFNLHLARRLKRRGLEVIYFISPQVWAWRRGRVKTIARWVDSMLVLFPFEVDFYRRWGVRVAHVGHPLVDEVPELPQAWDAGTPASGHRLALLPGSRPEEIARLLPVMLEGARQLAERLPIEVVLVGAPTVGDELMASHLAASQVPVRVVRKERFEAVAASHLAWCASGTATLEVGLLGTPMIVVYRVGWASWLLGRLLVRLPHVSLVNLVLGRRVVPELLQSEVTPEALAEEAGELLGSPRRVREMRRQLAGLRSALGPGGASRAAAAVVASALRREGAP